MQRAKLDFNTPHANRAIFTELDREAILEYLDMPGASNSFFGHEQLLREYEAELAEFFGQAHCILTNSGTSALFTAFFCAGISPGDEVIVPAYTFHASVVPILQLGGVPRFVYVCPNTANICPQAVSDAIGPKTKAIVVTHQWGHPAPCEELRRLADKHDLKLIEDVSLAVGSTINGARAGSFGDFACLSLGSTKLLSGGQGGAVLTRTERLKELANLLGHFEKRSRECVKSPELARYATTGFGHNFRIHVLSAVVSRARFHRIDQLIRDRHARFNLLAQYLKSVEVILPPYTSPGIFRGSWQGFVARYDEQEHGIPITTVCDALRLKGLQINCNGYLGRLYEANIFNDPPRDVFPFSSKPSQRSGGEYVDKFPGVNQFISCAIGFPLFLDEDLELVRRYGEICVLIASEIRDRAGHFAI